MVPRVDARERKADVRVSVLNSRLDSAKLANIGHVRLVRYRLPDGGAAERDVDMFSSQMDGRMRRIDGVVREVGKALADGYVRIKLKIMPGRDVEVVRAVRRKYPHAVMHVDCNGAYRMASVSTFRELDQYDLAMIEQPLSYDDLLDHAKLQNELATPICLDESVTSVDKARKAIEIGACRWINVKVGRVGGLTNAVLIHDLCKKNGIGCLVGGMLESALGQAASLALATLPNFTYPADIFSSDQFYQVDLAEPAIQLAGPSRIEANAEPGLGRVPNADLLTKMTIRKAVLRHE